MPRSGTKMLKTPRLLKSFLDGSGYPRVKIYKNGKGHSKSVHRHVAESFLHKKKHHEQVNHINGIKTDNRVENLEWCTKVENMRHAVRIGHKPGTKGERCNFHKLKEKEVIAIFNANQSRYALAEKYGVSYHCIRKIKLQQNWKHLWEK